MEAQVREFMEKISAMPSAEKDARLMELYTENLSLNDKVCHFERMTRQVSQDFNTMKAQAADLKEELADLSKKYRHVCDLNVYLTGKLYGTSSEQYRDLVSSASVVEEDPVAEDAVPDAEPESRQTGRCCARKKSSSGGSSTGPSEKKPRRPRSGIDLSRLERIPSYDLDPDELDRLCEGEG